MKKVSKIVHKIKILNYKKKKNKTNLLALFLVLVLFSPFSRLSLTPSCSDLTGISKIPDLGQTWKHSTDALKEKKKIGKLGFCVKKVVPMDHSLHFIGTDLWFKGLRDACWKCHVRLMV